MWNQPWLTALFGIIMWFFIAIIILIVVAYFIISPKPSKLPPRGAHVMITGGSSGIGLAIAKECARLGSSISIIARDEIKLRKAKIKIEKLFCERQNVVILPLDVASDAKSVKTAIGNAVEKLGPVDILFNCAGISHAQKFEETDPKIFERLMQVNYLGSVNCSLAVLPEMKRRKSGRIVFISSQAGQLGLFGYSAYSATKFALRGLAEALQMEVKPYNIGVTLSFPPDTDTPGFHLENNGDLKPEETKLISQTSGLHSVDSVAKTIISDSLSGEFLSTIGLEGFILGHVTCGMAPSNSLINVVLQGLLLGIFRIIGLAFHKNFDSIVTKCALKNANENTTNKDKET